MTVTPRHRRGFTLIELLVTVMVVLIVLAFGVPAFADLMAGTRVTSVTNTLVGHLQTARSDAVKRGRNRVAVGPYGDNGDWLSDTQAWGSGYMIAVVDNASPPAVLKVLRRVDGTELAAVTITTSNSSSPRIIFLPSGASSVSATLTVCDKSRPTYKRGVVIDNVGRVRASGYKPGGTALVCTP